MTQLAEPTDLRGDQPLDLPSVGHWIGNAVVAGTSGRRGPVFDPATGSQTKWVDFASTDEVDAAVAAASAAFPGWRATSLSKRTDILFRIRNLVEARRKELAAHLTAEHGRSRRTRSARSPEGSRTSSSRAASRTCSRVASASRRAPAATSTRSA